MREDDYSLAGWLAIAAAVLVPPMIGLGLLVDIVSKTRAEFIPALLLPYIVVVIGQALCSLYAFYRFRSFLNDRYRFHDVDGLIVAIIIGVILITCIIVPARVIGAMGILDPPLIFVPIGLLFLVSLPVSILGIIFAIRLLRLDAELYGFKKPYAGLTIAASVCFMTFVLAPVGLLIDAIGNVLLGLIYLKPEPEIVEPEFV